MSTWIARRVGRVRGRPLALRDAAASRSRWRRRSRTVDPFETLQLQLALGRLDREIAVLRGRGEEPFACAHHLRAATAAYDALLADACRLAGVDPLTGGGPALQRVVAEAELHLRGWEW